MNIYKYYIIIYQNFLQYRYYDFSHIILFIIRPAASQRKEDLLQCIKKLTNIMTRHFLYFTRKVFIVLK